MNSGLEEKLKIELHKRKESGTLRLLKTNQGKIDFSSNDYLGVVKNQHLIMEGEPYLPLGATGSRLLSGNHSIHQEFENNLSELFQSESAILMNSGYSASLSLLSLNPQKRRYYNL